MTTQVWCLRCLKASAASALWIRHKNTNSECTALPALSNSRVTVSCTSKFLPFGAAALKLKGTGSFPECFLLFFPPCELLSSQLYYTAYSLSLKANTRAGGCVDIVETPVHDVLNLAAWGENSLKMVLNMRCAGRQKLVTLADSFRCCERIRRVWWCGHFTCFAKAQNFSDPKVLNWPVIYSKISDTSSGCLSVALRATRTSHLDYSKDAVAQLQTNSADKFLSAAEHTS